ncbi:unnamed protein product [Enterobius vermicularis]|uniref:KH domain-containing protein n=1 Tax=Enterobius vermicularis TaxID=51028 RepID=A0A0N4VD52_ENTVE|nr:unnamed protein product [Enterobius vermicularis]
MSDDMSRRIRLGRDQKRLFDAERFCGSNVEHCPDFLKQPQPSEEVTLAIEVPNADYPGIIGLSNCFQNEDSIPLIMQETGVRVQFPDVFPTGANANYVNQVKLIGFLEKVEEARKRIRKLFPVSIAFHLDYFHPNASQEKMKKAVDEKLFEQRLQYPHLKISILSRPAFVGQFFREIYQNADVSVCVIEGAMCHEKDIYDVCEAINSLFYKNEETEASRHFCVSWMNIPLPQQLAVTGFPDGFLMRLVSLKSNAAIFFPTPSDRHVGATMFYFTGTAKAAILARKYIQALLPVSLTFEVEHVDLVEQQNAPFCCREGSGLDVKVHIKSSSEFERVFNDDPIRDQVTIESAELNLDSVYKTRTMILKMPENVSCNLVPEDYKFVEEDFRTLVRENNRFVASSETWMPLRSGVTRVPPFDSKVPAPYCSSDVQRPLSGWPESVRPLQACFVGNVRPATAFNGPVFMPSAGPQWGPSLQHSSSLPSFGYQQYHSPSATIISDDRSFADSKADHSQCSSNDAPTTAVQQLLDSFKPGKSGSSGFKRHGGTSRPTQYV